MIEFKIKPGKTPEDEYIALNQLLKALQLCESGAMANVFISDGLVKRNGDVETRKRAKIRKGDRILFEGQEIIIL